MHKAHGHARPPDNWKSSVQLYCVIRSLVAGFLNLTHLATFATILPAAS